MINVNLLPKNLRRRREPGYWRLIAVLFPLVALIVVGVMQFAANQTVANRENEKEERELALARLRPFIEEQEQLQARQRSLSALIAIANSVKEGRIVWSDELLAMLETLPPRDNPNQPTLAFERLTMRALEPGEQQERVVNRTYEGQQPFAEMEVRGKAESSEVLADYILALQESTHFEVAFQSASLDETTGLYDFTLSIGALTGARDEP